MENFTQIWKALDKQGKAAMAISLDTSVAYLSQIAHGVKPGKHFKRLLISEIERQERLLNQIGQVKPKFNRTNLEPKEVR